MNDNIVESLDYNIKKIESLNKIKQFILNSNDSLRKEVTILEKQLLDSRDAKTYYGKAIDAIYEKSIGVLKDTVNTAIQYVLYDKNYEIDLVLEDKRGSKSLNLLLRDIDSDVEIDLKDGVGQGIRTVVAFVLKMYYLLNKNSYVLFLDEKYSNLSQAYISRFFEFVKQMCVEKGFILVMISHDTRFTDYADQHNIISDGCLIDLSKARGVNTSGP